MKLLNKILIVLVALTFITFLWVTSNVKAVSNSSYSESELYGFLQDGYSAISTQYPGFDTSSVHYLIYNTINNNDEIIHILFTQEIDGLTIGYRGSDKIGVNGIDRFLMHYYQSSSQSAFTLTSVDNNSEWGGFSNYLYSDFDVYTWEWDSHTVAFQVTPLQAPQVTGEVTLAGIVEQVEMDKTLLEIVSLLPLIIVVVVSLVGLRKGLAILVQVLRRA